MSLYFLEGQEIVTRVHRQSKRDCSHDWSNVTVHTHIICIMTLYIVVYIHLRQSCIAKRHTDSLYCIDFEVSWILVMITRLYHELTISISVHLKHWSDYYTLFQLWPADERTTIVHMYSERLASVSARILLHLLAWPTELEGTHDDHVDFWHNCDQISVYSCPVKQFAACDGGCNTLHNHCMIMTPLFDIVILSQCTVCS